MGRFSKTKGIQMTRTEFETVSDAIFNATEGAIDRDMYGNIMAEWVKLLVVKKEKEHDDRE